jgi:hypothetical protein
MSTPINMNMVPTPIVLRTTATIPSGGVGTVPVSLDSTKIQNTLRVPIEITTMIVTVHGTPQAAGPTYPVLGQFGAAVDVDLSVHRYKMTDGFVPFPVLAAWNDVDDAPFSTSIEPAAGNASVHTERTTRVITFPQPIRLAPGVGFSGRVRRNPPSTVTGVATAAQTIAVTLIGKTLPEGIHKPTVQRIPFWTSGRIAMRSAGRALPLSVDSSDQELRNPLSIDLAVDRMITASITATAAYAIVDSIGAVGAISAPRLQLRWPNGDLLNSDDVVEQAALFARRHSYVHPFTLSPNTRVRATLRALVATDVDFLLALFGTRPEVL